MRYSDLFDQEFLDLARVRDGEVKGLLSRVKFVQLPEKLETQIINHCDPRYLQSEGIYVPFTSMPFDCRKEEAAMDLFKNCINQLEILVINSLKGEAKKKDENVKLPEEQFIRNFYFDNKNCEANLLAQIIKYNGRHLVCVGTVSTTSKLSQILKPKGICGAEPPIDVTFIPSNVISDDTAYIFEDDIFEDGKPILGCSQRFEFFCKEDFNRKICQAIGFFDATRFDEKSVVIVEIKN